MAAGNIFYYSTNTKLAHYINQEYYGGKHFVWCCPVFNPADEHKQSKYANIPPSSNPHNIFCRVKEDIKAKDKDSSKIKANRMALKKGASIKLKDCIISEEQYGEIIDLIELAPLEDFKPYIYVIREDMVRDRVRKVPVTETANPLGIEYQIHDLDSGEFEIIDIQSL